MPGLSFVYPEMLWLLAPLGGLWALALAAPRRLSPARFYGSLALRSALVACLVLAVAGVQLRQPVDDLTTVFLLDGSDSVAPSARAQAETFIQEALQAMRPGDRAAVVLFGGNALVERAPSELARLSRITAVPVASRTNIAEAIQLGLALFPADTQKRLVLLSDGGENAGSALAAAGRAAARGVPIAIVDLAMATDAPEAMVTALAAPAHARHGQDVTLDAVVTSSVPQTVVLTLVGEAGALQSTRIALVSGENRARFVVRAAGGGFQRYSVRLAAPADLQPANNEATAMIQVQGPPRLLLVAPDPADAAGLASALAATRMAPEVVTPEAMPADLAGLSAYEAVVLVNTPARSLPIGAMAALPGYVRDLGKGLLMVGGDASFGVGGYGRTPVEEAMPVYMDVRDREERPDLALVFVIDKSGSMDACHCAGPDGGASDVWAGAERKVDIAKQAVADAAATLGERDTIGVVTFDRAAYNSLPATRGASLAQVTTALAPVLPRGSTNVREGLLAAQRMLAQVDARLKHLVLLTDGWGTGGNSLDLAEELRAQGVTLSVVAAGGGSAGYLEQLAVAGGGRYYDVAHMAEVPQIFVQETITTVGNYIVERPFTPVAVAQSPVLAGIGGLPTLYGFNGSTLKASARPVLLSDDGQPLLATWQYGLGRSAAWLSDARGQWAAEWLAWAQFPRFAAQLAEWLLPVRGGQQTTTEVGVSGGETTVRLSVGAGSPAEGIPLAVTATVVGPDGARASLDLRQTAPGVYQGSTASPAPGTYVVQVAGRDGERVLLQETAGLVVPYSAEYGPAGGDRELLLELAALTGGAAMADGAEAFAPTGGSATRTREVGLPLLALALALLPFDILIRRVAVRPRPAE